MYRMKKLCIATYVFGKKYQGFIPIYIYSIMKNYPEYDIRIYVDKVLSLNVRKQLDLLPNKNKFKIIENYNNVLKINNNFKKNEQILRSLRWLIYDEAFNNYDSIYIGDIDIFICKEDMGIYEQHIKHAEYLKLPYSNCIRNPRKIKPLDKSNRIKNLLKYSFSERKEFKKYIGNELLLFSGLHFIITKDYFPAILNVTEKFKSELIRLSKGKSKKWNRLFFNNEQFLYELIKESQIGLPPLSKDGISNDNLDFNTVSFRPHHGLHLGIFRTLEIAEANKSLLLGKLYIDYYKQFVFLRENDHLFKLIESYFSSYIKKIINNMDLFYEKYLDNPS